jgi:hypothetical protein
MILTAMPPARSSQWKTLVRVSIGWHISLILCLIVLEAIGWDTHAWFGRLGQAEGVILESTYWSEICGKLCQPVYRSEVAFTDGGGRSRRFHIRWVEQFKPGKGVTVEYFIGRASQARIRNTADMTGWIWMVLSGLCGLGFPAIIGCTVVACQELHTLWKKRALAPRPSRNSVLGYLAMSALALLAEATLALYLYWY